MEPEPEFDQLSEDLSPTDHHLKLKRLKKKDFTEDNLPTSSAPSNDFDESERGNESDGLDPLFGEPNQFSAKRVLEFDGFESEDDPDFESEGGDNNKKKNMEKKRQSSVEFGDVKAKKKRTKSDVEKARKERSSNSNRREKRERKARFDQQADYQRVMRDMKGVGFKPIPMVEKSISSVLEKIRQRKREVSKKWASYTERDEDEDEDREDGAIEEDEVKEYGGVENDQAMQDEGVEKDPAKEGGGVEKDHTNSIPLKLTSEDDPLSSDEQITNDNPLVDEVTPSFRAPINDTQDLLLDSERSNLQGDELLESSCPVEDLVPSAPSLNLEVDSAFDEDDISSNHEESDKENTDPHPKHLFKGKSTTTSVTAEEFVDLEASEDDVDYIATDEDDDSLDMEENCDYIATDVKEKPIDGEIRNQFHQQWDQQQDEAVTKKLLQKLHYGAKEREPSISDDEDANRTEDEEEEEEEDVSIKDVSYKSSSRATTKRIKQMIPQMFTDEDDGFVSSDDEETERRLTKQCLLQKVEMEQKSKYVSSVADKTSSEVFTRIKKLNVIPDTKKKAKTPTIFDALLNKGSGSNSSKSSFLRRASSQPGSSSHRQGPSTGKSFIFGRDDSNSRSSMSSLEDSLNLGQKESQQKKSSSAKISSSQAKWSTQHTETRVETDNGTSLFDILQCSSVETSYDTRDNMVDHEAVFAAFKSVKQQVVRTEKKQVVKTEGRSYQGA